MKKILLATIAIILFSSCATQPTETTKTYEDDYISFQYPAETILLQNTFGEGEWTRTLEWLTQPAGENYLQKMSMFGTTLQYPYNMQNDGHESIADIKTATLAPKDPLTTVLDVEVGNATGVLIDTTGFCEHNYQLYVQSEGGTVYNLSAGCADGETWDNLYNTFVDSVEFKK